MFWSVYRNIWRLTYRYTYVYINQFAYRSLGLSIGVSIGLSIGMSIVRLPIKWMSAYRSSTMSECLRLQLDMDMRIYRSVDS